MITDENFDNPHFEKVGGGKKQGVVIGDGVWIGQRSIILSGVTIGEHSIIGANSVVTHDIPAFCIAAGQPAKILKRWDFYNSTWVKYRG